MGDAKGITVLGICGSLRKGSYNMAALRTAIEVKPPGTDQPFAGKPAAIMGAGAGMAGTAHAQGDLRRACVFLDVHSINKPEVRIGQAHTKFDTNGGLTDDAARGFIRDMLVALESWTRQISRSN